jgi:hypothetical protein
MANNHPSSEATSNDDFFDQILGIPSFASADTGLPGGHDTGLPSGASPHMMLQLGSGDTPAGFHGQVFPLGLSLEQGKGGFLKPEEASGSGGKRFRDDLVDSRAASMKNVRYFLLPLKAAWLVGNWRNLTRKVDFLLYVLLFLAFLSHERVVVIETKLNGCL